MTSSTIQKRSGYAGNSFHKFVLADPFGSLLQSKNNKFGRNKIPKQKYGLGNRKYTYLTGYGFLRYHASNQDDPLLEELIS